MSHRPCLGWHALVAEWEPFVDHVVEKWGEKDGYLRFELESAMREFIDGDADLVEAEQLLRRYMDARELSSSSDAACGISLEGDTKKVMQRVQEDLKDEFKKHAKKRYDANLGVVLSRALRSYRMGGRKQRVKDLVHQLTTDGIAGDTMADSDESVSESQDVRDTTGGSDESLVGADESTRDTTAGADESSAGVDESTRVDAMLVSDIAGQLEDAFTIDKLHKQIAMHAGGAQETIDLYSEAVIAYENVVEHPVNDGLYIPPEQRENMTVYDDLDRGERVETLRELLVVEALEDRKKTRGITYSDVQDLFDEHLHGAPSHDYAYKLMAGDDGAAAADAAGFGYEDTDNPHLLTVDVTEVAEQYLLPAAEYEDVDETLVEALVGELNADLEEVDAEDGSVNMEVGQFEPGPMPSQEAGADD